MKKIVISLFAVALLASCSSTTDDVEAKRQELQKYKQQQHELSQKIEVLEKELASAEEEEVIKVEVAELTQREFEHFIEVNGNVEAEYNINVSPESVGVIEAVYVKEGQHVSKGELLAKLKTETLQRSIDQLNVQLDLATTNYKRQKNLWDQNIGSEMQYLQAKTNMESLQKQIEGLESQIEMSEVKSPVDGVVDEVFQEKGDIGSPQAPFAKVVNINNVKIYADISEAYLTKVKTGDKVKVFFPAINKEIETPIRQIGNVIDPNSRTFRLRLDVNNSNKQIKPNLRAVIKIRDYVAENAIVVPTLFVKEDFSGEYTYIAENSAGKDIAKKVYVSTGVTNNNMTEVVSGLEPGMKIISEGYNQIMDGSVIKY
ncbi:efflux RND transporter periplasmic adaptor subunit [Maribellus maritimus]|uniref:efflux RND transporter periplasmic adaptor subunit n=1 Tax=Maribellus maritimus TaxID=2870838 RepID=UPI001EEBBA66|nr:efflux RND transporter periplasmic adaptor subunit [Maribellus maritimus]MCG6190918.1 efflux RND transporter periplasmic adaptor subunit [Maribellus maritimus]